ncbi:MAG: hypothetical protein Q9163_001146 [Psora crenata]
MRFQNAGLTPYWPYCNAARQLSSVVKANTNGSAWDKLEWRRRLETFGDNDTSVLASGPKGQTDGICNLGELTDKGRETTLALGQRLRRLYVDQLHYMPNIISDADMIYLRATPMARALESVQQSFWGMYPLTARTASFPPPTIVTRTLLDETLYPNEGSCRRFNQLVLAFGQRAADRWNTSPEMAYLSSKISKWMPNNSNVAVDSHPRLSGIMDTINSSLAHGPETRLPSPFYDAKARDIIDKIGVEEWFGGYKESNEYRQTGIGPLAGDIVARMVGSVEKIGNDGLLETGSRDGDSVRSRGGETDMKFGMSGCHDTTLAALLASLGCFEGEKWPPYTSHIAFELFTETNAAYKAIDDVTLEPPTTGHPADKSNQSRLKTLFSKRGNTDSPTGGMARKKISELSTAEKHKLAGHYVRVRYNDRPMTVPGCRLPGKHLDGDESFCTLVCNRVAGVRMGSELTREQEAFKAIVDKFTPRSWGETCVSNLQEPAFPAEVEPPGY